MIFDSETLQMLFEETGMSFDEWVDQVSYSSSMTDQEIYNLLPGIIKDALGDFNINASWMHHGM